MRAAALLLSACLVASHADACTTVAFLGGSAPVFAYNYDFDTGVGHVLVNPRGMAKISSAADNPARWQSRFGSVTFVQFGRDHPMSGMNEAGLAVSQMWLDESRYEMADARPAIGVLEWMQYLLDTSATVEEALARAAAVRIQGGVPLHYAIADAVGDAAVVEFIDGHLAVRRGKTLPHTALTNSTYAQSVAFTEQAGGEPAGVSSLARFTRAAAATRTSPADPVAHAFATLAGVAQPGRTRWSIVYHLGDRTVRWRSQGNAAIRAIDLDAFDLSCRSPLKTVDVHDGGEGDAVRLFGDYDATANADLVLRAYAETPFLRGEDPAETGRSARLADRAFCAE